MMRTVAANILQVVVLTADPHTLLRIRYAWIVRRGVAQKKILELVHARIGKHQRGVFPVDDGRRGYDLMLLVAEEIQKLLPDFTGLHHGLSFYGPQRYN